jgi:hypothetical protein
VQSEKDTKQQKENKMSYNGWKNYETWLVHLWITENEKTQAYWETKGKEATDEWELAGQIKDEIKEGSPSLPGMYDDLLRSALDEVSWNEIARAFMA